MSALSSWPVQQAIYTALTASTAVKALVGNPARIYDQIPANPAFPYIDLGEDSAVDWGAKGLAGADLMVTLHAWSREKGRREAKQILDAIHGALHEQNLTVSGHTLVLCRFEGSDVFDDPDGLTRHGIIRFRFLTHT